MSSDPVPGNLFNKLKNKFSDSDEDENKDHLKREINDLYKQKKIDNTEFSMLDGVLDFQDKMVHEVMVPRTDAFMINASDDFQDNLDEILHEPYSRIPVYQNDKDKVIGIIHIRSILRKAKQIGFDKLDYTDVMSKPLFAPETTTLNDLLVEMQNTQQQLAILTDEYGGVVGLATIEDLLEEIVGDIDDEVDQAEVLFNQIGPNEYTVYGKMPLDDFNEQFGTNIEMENVDTVAGYVITKLGVIPTKGEKLCVKLDNGMVLTTKRVMGSRLLTVLLTIPKNLNKEEEQEN